MIKLELFHAEAVTLRMILERISGNPENSPRYYTISIDDKLREQGVLEPSRSCLELKIDPEYNEIRFLDFDD